MISTPKDDEKWHIQESSLCIRTKYSTWSMMSRYWKVVENTQTRVKNNTKLTNFMKSTQITKYNDE